MRRWGIRLGVWLGVLAVAVTVFLPYHLTTDIVHAVGHLRVAATQHRDDGAGHPHDRYHHHHHHDGCAICVSLSAAATTTTLPTQVDLAPPQNAAASEIVPAATAAPARPPLRTPYAPRAPPVAA